MSKDYTRDAIERRDKIINNDEMYMHGRGQILSMLSRLNQADLNDTQIELLGITNDICNHDLTSLVIRIERLAEKAETDPTALILTQLGCAYINFEKLSIRMSEGMISGKDTNDG